MARNPGGLTSQARPASPASRVAPASQGRASRLRPGMVELVAVALLVLLAVAVVVLQREVLTRQLWGDESWRAYQISLTDGFWGELRRAEAPFGLLWLVVERAAIMAGGNTVLVLRLPVVAAFVALGPLTYAVGRRWLSVPVSFATAGLLLLNGPIFAHAVQLKPFALDCAASVGALWLWLLARERSRRPAGRLLLYLGIAGCSLLAVAAAFTVGFVLLLDLVEFLRSRRRAWSRLVAPVTAGAVSAAHLVLFVLPQHLVTGDVDWQGFYPPRDSVAAAAGFVGRELAGFVPGMVTQLPRYVPVPDDPVLPLAAGLGPLVTVFLLAALGAGMVAALAARRARLLAGLLAWCVVMELVASALRLWPFGLTRVNYFLLPFVYLLAGVGVSYALAAARRAGRAYLAGVLAVIMVGCAALVVAAGAQLAQARRTANGPVYELRTAELVAWTRLRASPADLLVLYNPRSRTRWAYYMRFYQGYDPVTSAATRIGPERTVVLPGVADEQPLRELARDRTAGDVFLVLPINAQPARVAAIEQALSSSGYRPTARTGAYLSSTVEQFARPATAATSR